MIVIPRSQHEYDKITCGPTYAELSFSPCSHMHRPRAYSLLQAVSRRFGSSVLIAAQDMTFVNLASFLSQ